MGKYEVLGTIVIFWFLLPFPLMFVGLDAIEKETFEDLVNIESPTIVNYVFIFVNWMAYFFRILTFSLPNAPLIISLLLFSFIPISALAIISVFRGD